MRLRAWMGVAAVVASQAARGQALVLEGQKGKLPFTIGPSTTVITEPLDKDGAPDYAAALNERYGKGVTAESNGFVVFLKVMGTGMIRGTDAERAAKLKQLGAEAGPQQVWETSSAWAVRKEQPGLSDALAVAGAGPWKEADHAEVAACMKEHAALLDLAVAAAGADRDAASAGAWGRRQVNHTGGRAAGRA